MLNESDSGATAAATIDTSSFIGNRAMVGGALGNFSGSRLTVRSSTLSGNAASGDLPNDASAGIANSGELALRDVTITESTCDAALGECGGGLVIYGDPGSVEVSNSIIAGNPGGDCRTFSTSTTSIVVAGANLDSDNSCSGFTLHLSPRLGPLRDNGGPTQTHAIKLDSPALDAGTSCLRRDQRGEPRARSTLDPCDIGAFELQR